MRCGNASATRRSRSGGLTWVEIGRQLAMSDYRARKAFDRFFMRLAKKDFERMRDMEGERITDMRT